MWSGRRACAPVPSQVAELTKALFKLDPVQWRSEGSQESCDQWLWLMIACKAVGISREDWIDWCAGDEWYAGAGDEIGRKWDGVVAAHSDALFKALAAGGIRLSRGVAEWRSVGLHLKAPAPPNSKPPANLKSRSDGLLRWLSRNQSGDGLFSAACLLCKLGLSQDTATRLVSGNLPSLRRDLGDAEFTYQITRTYAWVSKEPA